MPDCTYCAELESLVKELESQLEIKEDQLEAKKEQIVVFVTRFWKKKQLKLIIL
jgi:hypothetical protein